MWRHAWPPWQHDDAPMPPPPPDNTADNTPTLGSDDMVTGAAADPPPSTSASYSSTPALPVAFAAVGATLVVALLVIGLFVHVRRRNNRRRAQSLDLSRSPSRHRRGHSRTSSLRLELGMKEEANLLAQLSQSAARRGMSMTRPDRTYWRRGRKTMDCVMEDEEVDEEEAMDMVKEWPKLTRTAATPTTEDSPYLLQRRPTHAPPVASAPAPWSSVGSSRLYRVGTTTANLLSTTFSSLLHTNPSSTSLPPTTTTTKPLPLHVTALEKEDQPGCGYTYRFPQLRPMSVGSIDSLRGIGYRMEFQAEQREGAPLRVINA